MKKWRERLRELVEQLRSGGVRPGYGGRMPAGGGPAGHTWTASLVARIPAAASGIAFIANSVAGLPMRIVRHSEDGSEDAMPVLTRQLNRWWGPWGMSAYRARQTMMQNLLYWGAAFAVVNRGPDGKVKGIDVLPTRWIDTSAYESYRTYLYTPSFGAGAGQIELPPDDLVVMMASPAEDVIATGKWRNPWQCAYESLTAETEEISYRAHHYSEATKPLNIFQIATTSPQRLTAATTAIRKQLAGMRDRKSHDLYLPDKVTFTNAGQSEKMLPSPELGSRLAGMVLQLPRHYLGDYQATSLGAGQIADTFLAKHTIRRWAEDMTHALTAALWPRAQGVRQDLSVQHDYTDLLRADARTRADALVKLVGNGIITRNEARQREGLDMWDPETAGDNPADQLFLQKQNVVLGEQGEMQAKTPEPAGPSPEDLSDAVADGIATAAES